MDPAILVGGDVKLLGGMGALPQEILRCQMLSDEFWSIFRPKYYTMILQILPSFLAFITPYAVLVGGRARPLPPSGSPTCKNPVFGHFWIKTTFWLQKLLHLIRTSLIMIFSYGESLLAWFFKNLPWTQMEAGCPCRQVKKQPTVYR